MKTTININGLDVEFTDQKPTKPGAYWWNRSESRAEPELVTVGYIFDPEHFDVVGAWGVISVESRRGLWSAPLVPATEVEKAWNESRQSVGCFGECAAITDNVMWATSNARRVVEGE